MAYTTIDWEYGDDSVIEGFRLYRDDVLRGTYLATDRQAIDNVDDTSERKVTYKVKAFDSAGRESYGCQFIEIRLMSLITPDMTSQNTPSGNVVGYTDSPDITIDYPWQAFDRSLNSIVFNSNVSLSSAVRNFNLFFQYKFSESTRLSTWGLETKLGSHNTSEKTMDDIVKIYGSNTEHVLGDLIDTKIIPENLADYTELLFDLTSPVYYEQYTVVIGVHSTDAYTPAALYGFIGEIYLYDRPEVT